MLHAVADQPECWPRLSLDSWKDTYATVHMWTQMVGKVRLRLTPLMNHWWNVPLYVTARGLTTSRIPYGQRAFELWFDFIRHQLVIETTDGILKTLPLVPRSVAEFYGEFMGMLRSAGIEVKIWRMPVEIPNPGTEAALHKWQTRPSYGEARFTRRGACGVSHRPRHSDRS